MTYYRSGLSSAWHRATTQAVAFDARWLQPMLIALLVALLIGGVWVRTLNLIEADRNRVLAAATNDLENLGRVNLEHAERTFANVDQLLKMVRWQYLAHPGQIDLQSLEGKGFFDSRVVANISLLDARGLVIMSMLPFTGRLDFSEGDYFKAHQAGGRDDLFISDVVVSPVSNKPLLHLSRRMTLKNGVFGGVMVVSMDATYFTHFYRELKLGREGIAALYRQDGTLLLRKAGALDQFEGLMPFKEFSDRIATGDGFGTFVFRSALDQVERIAHFRRTASFPLTLTLETETREVLAAQQVTQTTLLLQASIVSMLLMFMGTVMIWYVFARCKIEQSHRSELEQVKALTNRAPGMIYQYEEKASGAACFIFVSDGVFDLLGLTPKTVQADASTLFALIHPDDLAQVQGSIAQSARDLLPWKHESRFCLADGTERWLGGVSQPQKLDDGAIQWDGYLSDITERKRNEVAAQEANLAKSDFLSSMSHEIRSPLNAILGLAYLLEQATLNRDAHDMVRKIRASGRLLLGLINDILDVSKIEAGQMVMEQAPFRLSDVMDNVAVILKVALGEKDIKLIILPPPPGVYTLMGDVLRLEQVLLNLSINALKFTSVGQVEVSCELLASHHDQVSLRFCVRDTGIGIAPELQGAVFAAFTQADSATTRRFGGTGLGLSICRQLVELMGGEIGMTSVLGLGSQFWFSLPLNKVADSDISAAESLQLEALVVDDSDISLQYVSQLASGLGWQVRALESGEAALNHLLTHSELKMPEVVVLDWKLSGLDGLDTVRLIREQVAPEKCPLLIMMTHHSLASLVRAEGVERVDALLEKPVTASSLHHAVLEAHRKRALTASNFIAATPPVAWMLAGIRILVVDDSDINCEVARRIFQEQGALVSQVANGQEAIDWLQAHPNDVDLVLMDIQMPIMDGIEATYRLRLMPQFADLPIVALSAGAFRSQQEAAHAAGMTHFISKPFDVPSTLAMIQRLTTRATPVAMPARLPASLKPEVAQAAKEASRQTVMNVDKGLETWGDLDAYQEYLQRFVALYGHVVATLNEHLLNADRPAAKALAHKLAGVAASMALPQTFACAAEVERVLSSELDPASALAQLDIAMGLTLAAIERLACRVE